jgi:hypothetical protein
VAAPTAVVAAGIDHRMSFTGRGTNEHLKMPGDLIETRTVLCLGDRFFSQRGDLTHAGVRHELLTQDNAGNSKIKRVVAQRGSLAEK